MGVYKCSICGAIHNGEIINGFKCKYCGTYNHIEVLSNKDHSAKLEIALENLNSYDFDEADRIYKSLYDSTDDKLVKATCL